MKIIIEGVGIDLTPSLKTYAEKKLSPLGKFIKKFESESESEIVLELSRTTKHHHKGLVFRAEANLTLGSRLLRAEANGEDIRSAIDLAKDELRTEITKYKKRLLELERRGGRQLKKN